MIQKKTYNNQIIRILTSFILGSIGVLSFSPYNFWFAIYISFSGLLLLTLNRSIYQASFIGYFWGIGFFGNGINWLYISTYNFTKISDLLNIFIMILIVAYLSIYPLFFSFLQSYFFSHSYFNRLVLASPLFWYFIELFREYTLIGFPWLQFGYSQINSPLKYLAPMFGVKFITFFITIISGLFIYIIIKKSFISLTILFFLFIFNISISYINWYKLQKKNLTNISLVQGNISQSIKWNNLIQYKFLSNYLNLSYPFIKNSIVIWPESALSNFEHNINNFLININNYFKKNKGILITGAVDYNIKKNYFYNSILIIGNEKKYSYKEEKYRKNHLVPFGEFVPFKHTYDLSNSFKSGSYIQPQLKFLHYKTTASICYEIIFGKQLQSNFKPNSNFIINLANDAWFERSIGPWQHFQMTRMRALEFGRPLIRSTNNGVTAVVQANGNVQNMLPQFVNKVLNVNIITTFGITPYFKFGNFLLLNLNIIFFQIILFKKIKNIYN